MTSTTTTEIITITLNDGQTLTFPLAQATDVIRLTLAARKEGYDKKRTEQAAAKSAKKAERDKAIRERAVAADKRRKDRIARLEKQLKDAKEAAKKTAKKAA